KRRPRDERRLRLQRRAFDRLCIPAQRACAAGPSGRGRDLRRLDRWRGGRRAAVGPDRRPGWGLTGAVGADYTPRPPPRESLPDFSPRLGPSLEVDERAVVLELADVVDEKEVGR